MNVSGVGSVLESMAMGKSMVSSDNPPIRDYLEPGKTADVVPVGDAIALRTAVEALLSDNERMEKMGRLARERVVNLYGNEVFAHRFADALREICND
jgi:glycosyltransferase involved in cell wall biosynthesis